MSSNRLQELMKQTEPQYVEGSPLLLAACALYIDSNNGNCIAQIKWKNISDRKIKAVSVELEVFDSFDNVISNVSHHYRNVDVRPGSTFGEKEAILIDDEKANAFKVKIDAVSFDDGAVYRLEQKQCFAPLPEAQELPLTGEMLDQYKRDISKLGFKKSAIYKPQTAFGLWQCGCGNWQMDNSPCSECGAQKEFFDSALNPQTISKNLSEYKEQQARESIRIEAERKARLKAEEEKQRKEAEERATQEKIRKENEAKEAIEKKKKKKTISIIAAALAVVIGLVCGYLFYLVPQGHYNKGLELTASQDWDAAVEEFSLAGGFKDAATQILVTRFKEGEQKRSNKDWDGAIKAYGLAGSDGIQRVKQTYYEKGKDDLEKGNWDLAVSAFTSAGDYEDASFQINATRYAEGLAKREAKDWKGAEKAFGSADGYQDANTQLSITYYMEAEALRANGDWDGAIAIFASLENYSDAPTQIKETKYLQAKQLYGSGDYVKAYAIFEEIIGYKDTKTLLSSDQNLLEAKKDIRVNGFKRKGNIVTFGRYVQDYDGKDPNMPIDWIVVDVKDDKALLVCKYVLDKQPLSQGHATSWVNCTHIRNWLNVTFFNAAFNSDERTAILTSNIDGAEDKIFILSKNEINEYFSNSKSVSSTSYGINLGLYESKKYKFDKKGNPIKQNGDYAYTTIRWHWWTRTFAYRDSYFVYCFDSAGYCLSDDTAATSSSLGIRPAMWVDLNSSGLRNEYN